MARTGENRCPKYQLRQVGGWVDRAGLRLKPTSTVAHTLGATFPSIPSIIKALSTGIKVDKAAKRVGLRALQERPGPLPRWLTPGQPELWTEVCTAWPVSSFPAWARASRQGTQAEGQRLQQYAERQTEPHAEGPPVFDKTERFNRTRKGFPRKWCWRNGTLTRKTH